MDADSVLSSGARARSVPAVLDGEIIPPGRNGAAAEPPPAGPAAAIKPGAVLVGTVVAALLGLGTAGGWFAWSRAQAPDAAALTLGQLQHDIGSLRTGVDALKTTAESNRQDEAIRALKKSVDTLKAELDQARAANTAALAQITAKVTDRDAAPKLADIAARLDRLDRDPGPKLGEIASRLDRIEKQVSSPVVTGSIAAQPRVLPPGPMQSQPAERAKPTQTVAVQTAEHVKPVALESYVLRDVYDGIALVEGRSGGIREVTPGQNLPGAGEVRSIERRGRAWIVVTSRGIIDDSTW